MLKGSWPLWLSASICFAAAAFAQTGQFQPGANPVSNQSWTYSVATAGQSHVPTRAVYNGSSSACNITVLPNGASGTAVQFQNVQPGEFLPIQEIEITTTTCSPNPIELY